MHFAPPGNGTRCAFFIQVPAVFRPGDIFHDKIMHLKIGPKILLTMLAVTVPSLLLFSLLMVRSGGDILMKNISDHLEELSDISMRAVQDLILYSQENLLAIAGSPDVHSCLQVLSGLDGKNDLKEALHRLEISFLEFQQLETSIQAIRFIDAGGFVLVKVREGKIIPRSGPLDPSLHMRAVSSKAGRDFFKNTIRLAEKQIWISNLERGWMEGEEQWCPGMVRFATPVFFADGSRAGIIIINVWGKALGTMINRLIAPALGKAFIVERNLIDAKRQGIYLFHQNQSCEFGNQTGSNIRVFHDFPPSITGKWMSEEKGISFHPSTGDILVHRYFSPYGNAKRGWVIVVDAKRDVVLAPLAAVKKKAKLSALAIFVLMIAAVLFFARSLTLPIRAVIDGTHRISRDLRARIRITSRDEIGQLAAEINQMAATLEENIRQKKEMEIRAAQAEKLASIGEMAAGLAHELNTPLGNIRALASLTGKDLRENRMDVVSIREDLDDIITQTEKCSHIIGGLLGFARKREVNFSLNNINTCLAEAISLVRMRSEEKKVAIILDEDSEIPLAKVDGHQLEQVFINILLNGIDAVPENGRIVVSSRFDGKSVVIRFADTGCGIAPDVLAKIFDPFFSTKGTGQGTGLGLSISYGIIKNHGGSIDVRNREQGGAVFTVYLPMGKTGENG